MLFKPKSFQHAAGCSVALLLMVQRWAQAVKYPWVLEKAEGEKKKKKKKVKNLNRKVARAVN